MDALQPVTADSVATDTPCIRCRYSLRGLPSNSTCPECATPIERSLRGDLLIYSDPMYVRKLRTGATLVMASILFIVIMLFAPFLLALSMTALGTGTRPFFVVIIGIGIAMLGAFVVYLVGWWMLATPDRDQLSDNKGERPRTYVRYAVLGTVVMRLLSISVGIAGSVPSEVRMIITLVDNVAMAVGFIAGLVYVRWLATRLPNPKIHKRARSLIVLISVFITAGLVYTAYSYAGLSSTVGNNNGFVMVTGAVASALAIAGLVGVIMYYNLFAWLRKNLSEISKAQQAQPAAA